jgi:hypothetical protein
MNGLWRHNLTTFGRICLYIVQNYLHTNIEKHNRLPLFKIYEKRFVFKIYLRNIRISDPPVFNVQLFYLKTLKPPIGWCAFGYVPKVPIAASERIVYLSPSPFHPFNMGKPSSNVDVPGMQDSN